MQQYEKAVHIHPTVSEFIPVLIGNLKELTDAIRAGQANSDSDRARA